MLKQKCLQFEDLKTSELGQAFGRGELANCCKWLYGGVSWPGKRPGFAVVVAMSPVMRYDSHDICLLEETESFHMRDIVRQCGALDFKYSPEKWIGDYKNDASEYFVREMNNERDKHRRKLRLTPTPMLDMENLYPYILDEIRRLLNKGCRQLFLKDSKILNYLREIGIEEGEIAPLELGDYPAIESIAFAAIEMRKHVLWYSPASAEVNESGDNYDYKKHGFRR